MILSGTLASGNIFKVGMLGVWYVAGIYSSGSLVWKSEALTAEALGSWLTQWGPISGRLHPADGLKGCTFTFDANIAVIRSPYSGCGIVDQASISAEALGSWLLDRLSW